MRKSDLEILAQSKIADAALLFGNRRYSNAYYLAGYAVEFALKACIACQISAETIPDRKFINDTYSHSFKALVGLAGLNQELRAKQDSDPEFHANWGIAAEWNPAVRYQVKDRSTAQFLLNAIAEPRHGVLEWIKNYW